MTLTGANFSFATGRYKKILDSGVRMPTAAGAACRGAQALDDFDWGEFFIRGR